MQNRRISKRSLIIITDKSFLLYFVFSRFPYKFKKYRVYLLDNFFCERDLRGSEHKLRKSEGLDDLNSAK